ncbi:FkbM family methyltransferase [Amorphus sp. MBR-141]
MASQSSKRRRSLLSWMRNPLRSPFRRRVAKAVDNSNTARLIESINHRLAFMAPGDDPDALMKVGSREDARALFVHELNTILPRIEIFRAFRDAGAEGRANPLDEIVRRIEKLQLTVDAIRLDQLKENDVRREVQASLTGMLAETAGPFGSIDARLDHLQARIDGVARRVAVPLDDSILVRTEAGYILVPMEDPALVAMLVEASEYSEAGMIAVARSLVADGDTVIDVGANIGLVTLPLARQVGESGRVIAVEPSSRSATLLERSVALNGLAGRVAIEQCAAGSDEGQATLHIPTICGQASLLDIPEDARAEMVRVRRVDALVPVGSPVKLVKIDVEGFELEAWRGMARIVEENDDLAVIVEFGPSHLKRSETAIEEWLREFTLPGFTAYEINEFDGSIRKLRPVCELARVFTLNLLLLRRPVGDYPQLNME